MGLDISSLTSSLHSWETVEYISCATVFVGVAGETIAGVKKLIRSETCRVITERVFAGVLLLGLAGELTGLVHASRITGEIIDAVNQKASTADAQAAELREKAAGLEKGSRFSAQRRRG
jgi:hypothetical protein